MKNKEKILLAHGSGGRLTHELVKKIFIKKFSNKILNKLDDSAEIKIKNCQIAFTTDSYVVDPIEFPGGDMGRIAVCGTVNDLAVKGARPLAISVGFILEEGFEMKALERIVSSMKKAAKEAGVEIVTGDTKVVEKGKADKIFINTSGIGIIENKISLSASKISIGDSIIVNGNIADHGVTVMNARNNLGFKGAIKSDGAPLNGLIKKILSSCPRVKCIRDLTRGGLGTSLNELADASKLSMLINQKDIPLSPSIESASALLGLDPLYVANEGKIVLFVKKSEEKKVLKLMRSHKYGRNAKIIGSVLKEKKPQVRMRTLMGGERVVMMLEGDQLPRIC
ncbi:MAG: hydrogenase expression/formation protein HypE [Elusimicrobiales bacterium]|nr:hydrogenase expression/formation protein HypE [Elusimicrobiales bacterium]